MFKKQVKFVAPEPKKCAHKNTTKYTMQHGHFGPRDYVKKCLDCGERFFIGRVG